MNAEIFKIESKEREPGDQETEPACFYMLFADVIIP